MKNLLVFIGTVFTILSVLTFNGCKHAGWLSKEINLEEIKSQLIAGSDFEKETPFQLREFAPYLDGEWIGNAVSYGCYREGQAPGQKGPSEAEVLEDLNIISKYWNLIRVYNADDETERILTVIEKHNLPIKVVVGIWLENEDDNLEHLNINRTNVLRGIELANRFAEHIAAVSVGNECQVFWTGHKVNTDILINYIRLVRENTNLPITVADDYNFWNKQESRRVADELDFIITHIYPLWNGKQLENAIEWMDSTFFKGVKPMHPDKQIVLGETGWATVYNPAKNGPGEQGSLMKGEVSVNAQERYLIELNQWIEQKKITTFLFEAFDEPWKGGGENTGPDEVEKHWGVFDKNRIPKKSFENFLGAKNKTK